MRYGIHIPCLLLVACGTPQERAAEHALRSGALAYREGRFEEAAAIYEKATFDPRVAFNLGDALHGKRLWDTALTTFADAAERALDTTLQADAYHNLGNGWMRMALTADTTVQLLEDKLEVMVIDGQDIARKVRAIVERDSVMQELKVLDQLLDSSLVQASEAYKSSLRRAPQDEDSRHNLGLAQRMIAARVKEVEERKKREAEKNTNKGLSERALAIMQQADALVDQYRFTEALKVMQDGINKDPSLAQRQDYMNKLNVVTNAAKAK